jgi:alpha-tubulin suppressor-like RCC1 family protein
VSAAGEHSLALRADGTLWTWGLDYPSGLETGDPVALRRRPSRLDADRAFATVSAGQSHALALAKDGTLWAWGGNTVGQLGDGDLLDHLNPF